MSEVAIINLPATVNDVPNFTPDGRPAKIVKAYDNGAWAYFVTVQAKNLASGGDGWNVVLMRNREGRLVETILDSPHTGEDYVRSIRFAHGKLDGQGATLLLIAERNLAGLPIPEPAPLTYSVYRLEDDVGAFAADIEVFRLVRSWDAIGKFCNLESAMTAEFGLPTSIYASGLQPDGCMK